MQINLKPIGFFFPPREGKYLIRLISTNGYGELFDAEDFLTAHVKIFLNKLQEQEFTVDVALKNRKITHISEEPIKNLWSVMNKNETNIPMRFGDDEGDE